MKKTLQHSRVPSGTTSRSRSILNAESQNNMPDFGTWWQRLLSTASPSLYNVSVPTSSSSSTISTSSHDKNGRNKKQYKALQLDDFELDITPLNIEVPHDLDTSSHTHDNKQPSSNSSGSNASNTSTSMTNVILAWTSIVFAIIAGASIGPVFKYMAQVITFH